MTLLEMTVVILVLMSMISLLFAGSRAWKQGADRSNCIVQIHAVQKALRGHCNIRGHSIGDNVPDLQSEIIGYGKYVSTTPICPGSGTYSFGAEQGVNVIPPTGTLYMQCSLAETKDHEPSDYSEW